MKTTSLELSKQLKEAGAKQDADVYLAYNENELLDVIRQGNQSCLVWPEGTETCDSFDCHELLEGLPDTVCDKAGQSYCLELHKFGTLYVACYANSQGGCVCADDFSADTPTEALGKLKLWCLENGYCKDDEANRNKADVSGEM